MLQVLVDADNLTPARLRALLGALDQVEAEDRRLVVAGAPAALAAVAWPADADVVVGTGWQRADVLLLERHLLAPGPLVLATGDGDFAQLGARHPGPVLVVSGSPASQLRAVATVVDPVQEGPARLVEWLRAVLADERDRG